MSDWQPMETVPLNTRVLVWTRTDITPGDIYYVENFLDGEHVLTAQISEFSDGEWQGLQLVGEPVCWQPLPEPPAA